jgi:hypothetical protein
VPARPCYSTIRTARPTMGRAVLVAARQGTVTQHFNREATMSGIKYEKLTGNDLIAALRGGACGDLLEDAAYAAADEIDRLRGLLTRIHGIAAEPRPVNMAVRLENIACIALGECDATYAQLAEEQMFRHSAEPESISRAMCREDLPFLSEQHANERIAWERYGPLADQQKVSMQDAPQPVEGTDKESIQACTRNKAGLVQPGAACPACHGTGTEVVLDVSNLSEPFHHVVFCRACGGMRTADKSSGG